MLGKEVEAFEHEIADYIGVGYAIGCAPGTGAINLALIVAGVGRDLIPTPNSICLSCEWALKRLKFALVRSR